MEAVSTEGMEKAGTQDIKRYYGLNPEDYRGIALYLPDDVMGVNEVLIVRLAGRGPGRTGDGSGTEAPGHPEGKL